MYQRKKYKRNKPKKKMPKEMAQKKLTQENNTKVLPKNQKKNKQNDKSAGKIFVPAEIDD